MTGDPAEAWTKALVAGGYEHRCRSPGDFRKIRRYGQAWRRILRATGLRPPASAFEIGCGGGIHLATLAANGFDVAGIDISRDVAARARRYIGEVSGYSDRPLSADIRTGDFLSTDVGGAFDLVYHFGVVEHYLDEDRRRAFWLRAADAAKPGGHVVSVVPCGAHAMRCAVRERELLGYRKDLAEIDYTVALHAAEFREAGLRDIVVMPHSYLFFLSAIQAPLFRRVLYPAAYAGANAILPALPLPAQVMQKLAHTLIAIGRKPPQKL